MKFSLSRRHNQSVPQNCLEIPNYFATYNYPSPTKQLFETQSTQYHYACETTCTENNKFKWKEIMKLHIGSNNIETYQPYVNNILYSSLDETDIQTRPENYIIHLVKLIQGIANIQTNKVNELTLSNKSLTEQLHELTSQLNAKRNNDELVSTLKKQNKHQQQIINTYRTYLSRNNNNIARSNIISLFCRHNNILIIRQYKHCFSLNSITSGCNVICTWIHGLTTRNHIIHVNIFKYVI